MPFAPSILSEDANKVMHVIKNHKNPYMTISFDVRKNLLKRFLQQFTHSIKLLDHNLLIKI